MHNIRCRHVLRQFAKHVIVCTAWCRATLKYGTPWPSDIAALHSHGPGYPCADWPRCCHPSYSQADLDDRVVMSQGVEVKIEDSLANDVQSVAAEPILHLDWTPLEGGFFKGASAVEGAVAKHVDHGGNVFAMKGGDDGSPAP